MQECWRIFALQGSFEVGACNVFGWDPFRSVPHALDVILVRLNDDDRFLEEVCQRYDVGLVQEQVLRQRSAYLRRG